MRTRKLVEVGRESLLEESAEGVGGFERPVGGAQRQEAARVHELEANGHGPLVRREHPGTEERRSVVTDDDAGAPGERGKEPAAGAA